LIDVHHHCLPDVDDGPRDWDEAVALCRMSAAEGIETIVATPHVLRGRWSNTSRAELQSRLDELQRRIGPAPRLLLGSEYYFAHDINEALAGGSIVPLAGSHYVLIEFASNNIPPMVEQPLYRMQLDGWIPLIAHPERNIVFQKKPELLESLLRQGARTQITTASFTGKFGAEAQQTALDWLKRGMVHLVATDAHNTTKRPPVVIEARKIVAEVIGDTIAEALFVENPRAVIEGRAFIYDPELPYPTEKSPFLSRLKRFLGTS
jgi:protein-tyrosine phosphatase